MTSLEKDRHVIYGSEGCAVRTLPAPSGFNGKGYNVWNVTVELCLKQETTGERNGVVPRKARRTVAIRHSTGIEIKRWGSLSRAPRNCSLLGTYIAVVE
jgi:hypothetical protein